MWRGVPTQQTPHQKHQTLLVTLSSKNDIQLLGCTPSMRHLDTFSHLFFRHFHRSGAHFVDMSIPFWFLTPQWIERFGVDWSQAINDSDSTVSALIDRTIQSSTRQQRSIFISTSSIKLTNIVHCIEAHNRLPSIGSDCLFTLFLSHMHHSSIIGTKQPIWFDQLNPPFDKSLVSRDRHLPPRHRCCSFRSERMPPSLLSPIMRIISRNTNKLCAWASTTVPPRRRPRHPRHPPHAPPRARGPGPIHHRHHHHRHSSSKRRYRTRIDRWRTRPSTKITIRTRVCIIILGP